MVNPASSWFNGKRIQTTGGGPAGMPDYSIGLQLYTVRGPMSADPEGTLRRAAEIGYRGVEFAGYYGMEAGALKQLLAELHLTPVSNHVSYERMLTHAEEEIAYMKEIGGHTLTIPYLSEAHYASSEAWREVCRNLAEIGKRCRAEGIQLLYHNHDFEFRVKLEEKPIIDTLFESAAPEVLQMELDACWAYAAGYDPVGYIHKYQGRIPVIHLKDYRPTEQGPFTVELGEGIVPLREIAGAAAVIGTKWLIVEQDECLGDPLESVRKSYAWIQENL